jgi:hypothetical protein
VTVGAYLRNVEALNLQENSYHASFVLWLAWQGEGDPTKTLRLVNLLEAWALTLTPVFDEPQVLADGRRYQRLIGEGRFFHRFDLAAFPLDSQQVVIELEDAREGANALVFEVDSSSSVNETLSVSGWDVRQPFFEVVRVVYPGNFGLGGEKAHARVRFGVTLERPRRVFFVTMFPPIVLVMLCSWFIFFLKPVHVEARVGTVITALLTIVFLQLAFTDDIPYLGSAVLLDQVFNFSYVVITAILAECVVVMRWHDRAKALEASLATMPESERASMDAERRLWRGRSEALDERAKWVIPLVYAVGCAALVSGALLG